ncbi:MAG: efflux RND transporter periplasmic adaptor subunit [Chlorobi bacterium]|nr:efflux RND transporter periplasmic adaptor subunit [Chlorobiota bacterium]
MRFFYNPAVFFLITAIAIFAGCSGTTNNAEEENKPDHLIKISREQFREEKMQLGNTVMHPFDEVFKTNGIVTASPQSKADVYSYVSGVIKSISVNPGTYVRKGQELCSIQSKEFINMQQEYLGSLAKLKATESDYKRIKTLYDEKISSQKNFLAIESEYIMLNARIKALKAEFKILHVNLKNLEAGNLSSYLPILSPINGYITLLNCNLGEFIDSQTLLMKVIDNSDLQLYFYVYQENVNKLKEGQLLKIYSPDNTADIYKAKVISIGKAIDPDSKSIKCIAKPEDDLRKIFINDMYFQVEIIVDTMSARAIPSRAILKAGQKSYVLVKEKEEGDNLYFRKKEVKTGIVSDGFTQILGDKPLNDILIKGTYYFQIQ